MNKEEILKLYISDLTNLVEDSDAKRNRIADLEDELEALKQGQALPIDFVSNQRELLIAFAEDWYKDNPVVGRVQIEGMIDKYLAINCGQWVPAMRA